MSKEQKKKPPTPEHLSWLVDSRTQNQQVCARMYGLMTPECWKNDTLGYEAKTLVSIGFSLWRALFLADKLDDLDTTNDDTIYFFGEMLENNAINFTQDKNGKGFTFNYYLANVRFRLAEFKDHNKDFQVDPRLLLPGLLNEQTPKERWRLFQNAFKDAVDHFADRLEKFKTEIESPKNGR